MVREASGSNTQPGGTETLSPDFWDVSSLQGKTARLQIVDQATGGWGHINVDQILQTDRKPRVPPSMPSGVSSQGSLPSPPHPKWSAEACRHPARERCAGRKGTTSSWRTGPRTGGLRWTSARSGNQTVTLQVDRLPPGSVALSSVQSSEAYPDAGDSTANHCAASSISRRAGAGTMTRMGWSISTANTTSSSNTIPMDGAGETCTGATPSVATSSTGRSWGRSRPRFPGPHVQRQRRCGFRIPADWVPRIIRPWCSSIPRREIRRFSASRPAPMAAGSPSILETPSLRQVTGGNRDPKVFWHVPSKRWVMPLYVETNKVHTIHFFGSQT